MKLLLLFLLSPLFCLRTDNPEKYLADDDKNYKCIELYQKALLSHNPFAPLFKDSVVTKERAIALVDSLTSLKNDLPFQVEGSVIRGLTEHFFEGLYPTRYQDPMSYMIYFPLVQKIDSTAKRIFPVRNFVPKFGTFYDNDINAARYSCNEKDYIIMIDVRYPSFSHQTGKIALQPFKSFMDRARFLPEVPGKEIENVVAVDSNLKIDLLYTMLEFSYYELPPNDHLRVWNDLSAKLLQYWNNANEMFVIGHEYAHELFNHALVNDSDSDAINLSSWYNEVEADEASQRILLLSVENDTSAYQVGWKKYNIMGGQYYLTTVEMFEQFKSIFNTGEEIAAIKDSEEKLIYEILDSRKDFSNHLKKFKTLPYAIRKQAHPPTAIRKQLLMKSLTPVLAKNYYNNKEADDLENSASKFSRQMLFGLMKLTEYSKEGFRNAHQNRAAFEEQLKRQ